MVFFVCVVSTRVRGTKKRERALGREERKKLDLAIEETQKKEFGGGEKRWEPVIWCTNAVRR